MKYYVLYYDYECYDDIMCDEILNNKYETWEVCQGHFIDDWDPNITFVCRDLSETKVPGLLTQPEDWIAVSKEFIEAVSPYVKDEIQYLPVKLDAIHPQMKGKEYFIANIINVIDAIDDKASLHIIPLGVIGKYALKGDVIKGQHVFMCRNPGQSKGLAHAFVSEDVKKAICKANLSGFDFEETKIV